MANLDTTVRMLEPLFRTSFYRTCIRLQKSSRANYTSSNLNYRLFNLSLVDNSIGKWSELILDAATTLVRGKA